MATVKDKNASVDAMSKENKKIILLVGTTMLSEGFVCRCILARRVAVYAEAMQLGVK